MPDGTVTLDTEDVLAFWDPAPPLANETMLPFTVTLEPDDGEVGDESPQAAAPNAARINNARTVR
jgi:hypothetical protein